MPSPLRTPGRRLDMGGGSGDIYFRNESRGPQSKLPITRINFLALVVPIFNLAEGQNCSTFVRKKQISYFIITVFRRVLRHVSLPFSHVLLPQLCPVHVPPVCELEFEGIFDRTCHNGQQKDQTAQYNGRNNKCSYVNHFVHHDD